MPFLNEIATYLAANGVGVVATSIFVGRMPDAPDACCTLYEPPGLAPNHGFGVAGIQFETPSVQVVCRGVPDDYATPRALAATAWNALSEVQGEALSGTNYNMITPRQSPFEMKRDERGRVHIAFNALCEKEPS